MQLFMKGYKIPNRFRHLHILGEYVVRFIMDGTLVWEARKHRRTFLSNSMFVVPINVTEITLCGVGGGGGGAIDGSYGGESGGVQDNLRVAVIPGEQIPVVLGAGGAPGLIGVASSFGLLQMAGGQPSAHQGVGNPRSTCGGRRYDGSEAGSYYGGQASPFAAGGDGGTNSDGEAGSGGGASLLGGSGGSGRITISWLEG